MLEHHIVDNVSTQLNKIYNKGPVISRYFENVTFYVFKPET